MATRPFVPHPGAPIVTDEDPMKAGIGAAAWATDRADRPDLTYDGRPRIQPVSVQTEFHVDPSSPDPMGMTVIAGDGVAVGVVTDMWVDLAEPQLRYLTVTLTAGGTAILPIAYCKLRRKEIHVMSIFGKHSADVPQPKTPGQLTLLEEDMIVAWYAGGYRYAEPVRNEPLI